MTDSPQPDPRPQMAEHARDFHRRGWMLGTSGNLSARAGEDSFWITASGRSKGELTSDDFLRVGLDGEVRERIAPNDKPSAETCIHQVLYRLFPESGAIYHLHSLENNLAALFAENHAVKLPPLELVKGFGVWEENPNVSIPLLPNHGEVPRIAEDTERYFQEGPPRIPAFLIVNHGITVWGKNPEQARNFIETGEFLLTYLVRARQLR